MSDEERPPTRYSDEMLWRLDEKIKNHLECSKEQFFTFNKRIADLEKFQQGIEQPVHVAGMIILGLILAFVGAVGTWLWKIVTRIHIGP